jgi:uncharacterized protein YdeI (YjbR/CyaY-like superfamily)
MCDSRDSFPPALHSWRRWLEREHARQVEIWLVLYKADSGKQRLSLSDAVEEALCFGWIDGLLKSLDSERYALRFTPRRKGSNWSPTNVRRAKKLIAEGKMTEAGLAALAPGMLKGTPAERVYAEWLSPELERAFKKNRVAWVAFKRLSPSAQRQYTAWIMSARKPETRARRLQQAIGRLEEGKPLGMR